MDYLHHLNAIKKKNYLYKKMLETREDEPTKKYKKYKNKLITIMRAAEKRYYACKLIEAKDSIGKTWKVINHMISKKKASPLVTEILCNGESVNDPNLIADKFNDFFVHVGPNLAANISKDNSIDPVTFIKGNYLNSMYLTPVTYQEIGNVILQLKNTSSKGSGDIPVKLLKFCQQEFTPILTHLVNSSIEMGIFPEDAKIAKVVPIFKNDDKKLVTNYRPISILPNFSKIYEKIVFGQLIGYIK